MPSKGTPECGVKKRVRRTITLKVKYEVLRLRESGIRISAIGRELGLSRSTVQTIIKEKNKLRAALQNSMSMSNTVIRKKHGLIAEMENLLNAWIQEETQCGVTLSPTVIRQKARSIYSMLRNKQNGNSQEEIKDFIASSGWFMRFKTRHYLPNIDEQEEAADAYEWATNDCEDAVDVYKAASDYKVTTSTYKIATSAYELPNREASSFTEVLKEIILTEKYSPKQVFMVDEIGLYWKKMPTGTFIPDEGNLMSGFKTAKDHLTLLLGSNAEGDFKLKPLLVYRTENPKELKNYVKGTLPVIWKSTAKARMTAEIFEEWFTQHFIPEVRQYFLKNNLAHKALLLVNNANGYSSRIADIDSRIKVLLLPHNAFYFLQLDHGIIPLFYAYYLKRIFSQAIKASQQKCVDLNEFWRNYNILQGLKNIVASWEEVKVNNLKVAWRQMCPYMFNLSESTTAPNLNDIIEDIVNIANDLPNVNVTTDDIQDLLASHSEEPSDKDIVQLEAQEQMELEETSANTGNELTVEKLAAAFDSMKKAMEIFEACDPNYERSAEVNSKIIAACQAYRQIYESKKEMQKNNDGLFN